MDGSNPRAQLLKDLALLYIALAHGTDQELDAAEIDLIARKLGAMQEGLSDGTVLHAVKEALDTYGEGNARERLSEAVRQLSGAVPPAMRPRVLRDLTEIGKADDRFLFAEARFIGELVQAWREDSDNQIESPETVWSVFGPIDAGWSPVHDLALVYVTLAHWTDKELKQVEVEAIREKLAEWMPGAAREVVRRVWQEVLVAYEEEPEGRTFDDAVRALKEHLPLHQRQAVLDDLRYIADADGVLLVEERVLIEALSRTWDCGGERRET